MSGHLLGRRVHSKRRSPAEVGSITGENHDDDIRPIIEVAECLSQLGGHDLVDRIAGVGAGKS